MVFRSRHVGQDMREEVTLRNFSDEATTCTVEVLVDADFADLFAGQGGPGWRRGSRHGIGSTELVEDRGAGGIRAEPRASVAAHLHLPPVGPVARGVEIRTTGADACRPGTHHLRGGGARPAASGPPASRSAP